MLGALFDCKCFALEIRCAAQYHIIVLYIAVRVTAMDTVRAGSAPNLTAYIEMDRFGGISKAGEKLTQRLASLSYILCNTYMSCPCVISHEFMTYLTVYGYYIIII